MLGGAEPERSDPAESILTAVHKARSSTLLRRRRAEVVLHADPSEGLPLMTAFVRIEDEAVRRMITRVVEMLADTKNL